MSFERNKGNVWIPEAPKWPGSYAPLEYIPHLNTVTYTPSAALQFATREECQAWCDENPYPVFVPVEHGFA